MEAAGVAPLKAPFPAFGGKAAVADVIWEALGNPAHYIEPFANSAAVLLARPHTPRLETINDLDHYVVNFWRAVHADPDTVAHWADWPVHEADLHARHLWLINQPEWHARMTTEPDYYDAKIVGWWVWGIAAWIGSGWCSAGPAQKLPHLGHAGQGVHRQRPHPQRYGRGLHAAGADLVSWFRALRMRLRKVRILCGDWSRICTPAVLNALDHAPLGIFLDPPYSMTLRYRVYNVDTDPALAVAAWARRIQHRPNTRIVLAGYVGEHEMPGWTLYQWKAPGGLGNQGTGRGKANARKECLWFSPQCQGRQLPLF